MTRLKRPLVIAAGSLIVLAGLVLMPVPGPGGTPVFLAGLALLATEVGWAKRFLARFKAAYASMGRRKRLVLTYSMLAFYVASAALAWAWMSRPADAVAETRHE